MDNLILIVILEQKIETNFPYICYSISHKYINTMIKSVADFNFNGRKVLIRVDFNVPLNEKFEITDDIRISSSQKTIDKVINDGGLPILMSHLGRPDGEKKAKYSLKPVANYLISKGYKVHFAEDCIGEIAKKTVSNAQFGEVVLLENLRFYKEEEKNDLSFAKELASLGDCYINDAFGTAHRAHASTYQVGLEFQDRFAGYLIKAELDFLDVAISNPKRPLVAIIGGAKISGKIDVINSLMAKCDDIIIGGGMIFTFFKAMGLEIGKSLLEADRIEMAKSLIEKAKENNIKLHLPTDTVVAKEFNNDSLFSTKSINNLSSDDIGMDIGNASISTFSQIIENAGTVIWNGPMGVFEMSNFAHGTESIAKSLAIATEKGAITIVGGGDSASAIKQFGYDDKVSHVSTGGGASLEFLEGKELPGIKALNF
jgi:phosphoglycerate kinase